MYIIAEIGINHNGNLQTALQMIKAAYDSGADCVKFQKRNPEKYTHLKMYENMYENNY